MPKVNGFITEYSQISEDQLMPILKLLQIIERLEILSNFQTALPTY